MAPATPKKNAPRSTSLEAAVEAGLVEVVPGLVILDRDLELTDALRVHWVGVDSRGHLVLALFAEGGEDEVALTLLDAVRHGQSDAALIARHLDVPEVRADVAPRVFAVAHSFGDALVGRLAPVLGSQVELFEMRTLKSARGERVYLTRVLPRDPSGEEAAAGGTDGFLSSLPDDVRGVAQLVVRRLARVDDELDRSATKRQLLWRRRGDVLARLGWEDGQLRGSVPSSPTPFALRYDADVDPFVEEVLARYVDHLGDFDADAGSAGPGATGPGGIDPAPGGPSLEEDLPEDEDQAPPDVVLTPEELEAFRDD